MSDDGRNGSGEQKTLAFYDALLRGAVHRGHCPPTDSLLMLSADLLDADARVTVQRHVDQCQFCTEDLSILAVEQTADALSVVEMPWWSNLIQQGSRVIEAVFVPTPKPAFELRGDTSEMRRYVAGEYELVLEISKEGVGRLGRGKGASRDVAYHLQGQLVHTKNEDTDEQKAEVKLYKDNTLIQETSIDEFGMMSLLGVSEGEYEIGIIIDDSAISVRVEVNDAP